MLLLAGRAPTKEGKYRFTVRVEDATGEVRERTLTIEVALSKSYNSTPSELIIDSTLGNNGETGTYYSRWIRVYYFLGGAGKPLCAFTVTNGDLPDGLELSPSSSLFELCRALRLSRRHTNKGRNV